MNGNIGWDTTAFDPTIPYADGEKHVASKEFGEKQGQNGWRYQYIEGDRFVDLVYYPVPKQWRKEKDNATGTPFVGVGRPASRRGPGCREGLDGSQERGECGFPDRSAIPATARAKAAVTVSAWAASTYAPWYALLARDSHEGLVFGWDYFGHWASSVRAGRRRNGLGPFEGGRPQADPGPRPIAHHAQGFVGLFHGDLDEAGNEVLDWQYRYLWDYTRDRLVSRHPHAGLLVQRDRLGAAGRGLDRQRPGSPQHLPQGLSRGGPDAVYRRRRLPPRLGLVGSGGRLEWSRLPRHRQLSAKARHGATDLRLSLYGRPRNPRSRAGIPTGSWVAARSTCRVGKWSRTC